MKIGAVLGAGIGAIYSAYRDYYVHVELRTDFINLNEDIRNSTLQKANYIFREYAKKIFEKEEESLYDQHISCNLYVYPVRAGDGHVYEHADIYRFLTENYPAALTSYQQLIQRFPNDSTLVPPSSSPLRSGNVSLDNLRLDGRMMWKVSRAMADLFENLRAWESNLQSPVDQYYQNTTASLLSSPISALTEEQIELVDEKSLALKFCTNQPLSLEEITVVRQLFQPYITEIKERDRRICDAISAALFGQRQEGIISVDRYHEEMQTLIAWYNKAKELYE